MTTPRQADDKKPPRPGQIWLDRTPGGRRTTGQRHLRITDVDGRYAYGIGWYPAEPDRTRRTKVLLDRFPPRGSSYELLTDRSEAQATAS